MSRMLVIAMIASLMTMSMAQPLPGQTSQLSPLTQYLLQQQLGSTQQQQQQGQSVQQLLQRLQLQQQQQQQWSPQQQQQQQWSAQQQLLLAQQQASMVTPPPVSPSYSMAVQRAAYEHRLRLQHLDWKDQLYYNQRVLALAQSDAAACRGYVCLEPSNNYVYDSCELVNYGAWNVSQCAPSSKVLMDCIGVVCESESDGSVYNSCDMRQFGYDGYTCMPGSRVSVERTKKAWDPLLGSQVPSVVAHSSNPMQLQHLLVSQLFDHDQRVIRSNFWGQCQGKMCFNEQNGVAYHSCDLKRFGLDGESCLQGFIPQGGCGPRYGNATCAEGLCCSEYGFCGTGADYCASKPQCGAGIGECPNGLCCSEYGYCGSTPAYCGNSQQSTQECGPGIGLCGVANQCCSKYGYCGTGAEYCNVESYFG